MRRTPLVLITALLVTAASGAVANATSRSAPPVGPLPPGPTSTIQTHPGELVAFALPDRPGGRVWRVARAIDSRVLVEVSEANVGASVVLVFKAKRTGTAKVQFGLTRGERSKAYESRTFTVHVG